MFFLEDFFPFPQTPPPLLSEGTTETLKQHRWFIMARRCCCLSVLELAEVEARRSRLVFSRCSLSNDVDLGSLNENGWNLMRNCVRLNEWWCNRCCVDAFECCWLSWRPVELLLLLLLPPAAKWLILLFVYSTYIRLNSSLVTIVMWLLLSSR